MELLSQIKNNKAPEDKKAIELISRLKNLVNDYDKNAEVILFGSRSRGDWHDESDWDFLILSDLEEVEIFKNELRNNILSEIEIPLNEVVFVIVKNKSDWEQEYAVTNIYASIMEEGIVV